MTTKITRKVLVIVITLAVLLSSCNKLDNAINKGIDTGLGNKKPCSGLVC